MNTEPALSHAQAGEIAASMLEQGKSAAEVWNTLVSCGVERAEAEAIVRDVALRSRKTPAPEAKGSPWLWLAALVIYTLQVIFTVDFSNKDYSERAGSLGAFLGGFLGSLLIVGISSLWRSNRTGARRLMVFVLVSAVHFVLRLTPIVGRWWWPVLT